MAVIDTGTNSTRLLIADVAPGQVDEVERLTTVTRLGEGVDSDGMLHSDARERVHACVERYSVAIRKAGPNRVMVIATSSVRESKDGAEFITGLAGGFGYESRVLSGVEEASLSFSGAAIGSYPGERIALFDIGGGSTEVVTGRDSHVDFARSLALGCVRLTERFLNSDPVEKEQLEEAAAFVSGTLEREIDLGLLVRPDRTLAVAGTATALAAIDLSLQIYNRDLVHGHMMSYSRIEELLGQLAAMTITQKLDIPTMERGRADVIVAGTLILERLMMHTGAEDVTISERDILDGAALSMYEGVL